MIHSTSTFIVSEMSRKLSSESVNAFRSNITSRHTNKKKGRKMDRRMNGKTDDNAIRTYWQANRQPSGGDYITFTVGGGNKLRTVITWK